MGLMVDGKTNPGREVHETIVKCRVRRTRRFRDSYDEAQRGSRHASASRPVVASPNDSALFDELVMTSGETWERLIPASVLQALQTHHGERRSTRSSLLT
jgi:hypothetical protein